MKTEVPLCRRCCFCMPLRYGLLIWGYFILLPIALLLMSDAFEFHFLIRNTFRYYTAVEVILFLVTFLVKIFHFALTLLLIVASHKKDSRLLKIYYFYGIVAVMLSSILMITIVVYDVVRYWDYLAIFVRYVFFQLVGGAIVTGLQLYIIALVRSEILKLENSSKFEFHNIAAEAECGYYGPNDGATVRDNLQVDTQVAICNEVIMENSHPNNGKNCASINTEDIVINKNKINVLNSGLTAVVNKDVGYDKIPNEE